MDRKRLIHVLRGEIPTFIVFGFLLSFPLFCAWLLSKLITWTGVGILVALGAYLYSVEAPTLAPKNSDGSLVVIIGAGFSGLCMGMKLLKEKIPFIILEKSDNIGGTWWDNTYPGCACDVMSHLYSFSYFLNPSWSTSFPYQPEILNYLRNYVSHFNLTPYIKLSARVETCTYNEVERKWTVICIDGQVYKANFIVSGVGALHVPKIPQFKGAEKFEGKTFHTAQWDHTFDYRNKRVAIIGTGASAVQVVPAIKDEVKSLHVFQRTAVWTAPRLEFAYPKFLQFIFRHFPLLMKLHRLYIFVRLELNFFFLFTKGSKSAARIRKVTEAYMLNNIKKPELKGKLIPDFDLGCKRITVSNNYISSFNAPHVHLVTDGIDSISTNGIVIKGDDKTTEFDAIIYATGFDLIASCSNAEIIGKDGRKLAEEWGEAPNAYLGITCPKFPNLFYLLGPNVGLGHNTIIYMIECQANYTLDAIKNCIKGGIKSMDVKESINRNYQDYIQNMMKQRVFHSGCKSWYQNSMGLIFILWPSHLLHYWWMTRKVNFEEYELSY